MSKTGGARCRVRGIISVRAGLKMVPWDGYLKYSRPSPKHRERKYVHTHFIYASCSFTLVFVNNNPTSLSL